MLVVGESGLIEALRVALACLEPWQALTVLVRAFQALAVARYCLHGRQLCNTSTRCKCCQGAQDAASNPTQANQASGKAG